MIHPINESEKERIRTLHREHFILNEQPGMGDGPWDLSREVEAPTYLNLTPLIYPNNQLSEQVRNSDKLIKGIQSLVDHALVKLNNMSEEMGLGEMFFINEIDSVENIKVSDFYKRDDGTNMLHIIIEVSGLPSSYEYYKLTRYIIDDEINKIIPNTEVSAKINDTREFGPGIDW
jgi:hypothetical protein